MQVLPARGSIAMHVCERSRRALEAGPARTILEAFAIYEHVDIPADRWSPTFGDQREQIV